MSFADDCRGAVRRGLPVALAWTIMAFLLGLAFQAGIAWARLNQQDTRIAAIESRLPESDSIVTAVRIELSGLRADMRALADQLGQVQRRLDRVPLSGE